MSEKSGTARSNVVGIMCPLPPVEIGLTDMPKTGGYVPTPHLRHPCHSSKWVDRIESRGEFP